jgi:hypothetical protein
MLRTVLAHLRAQWMGALALFVVLTGGVAYAANTVFSEDIVDGEVKAVDLANNSVRTTKVLNGQLNDEDVGQGTFVNFAADIGGADHVIPESECEFAPITGINAQGDHMLLTPARQGTYDRIDFSIRYQSNNEAALLQSCNNGSGAQSTSELMHFNLLVFDAQ